MRGDAISIGLLAIGARMCAVGFCRSNTSLFLGVERRSETRIACPMPWALGKFIFNVENIGLASNRRGVEMFMGEGSRLGRPDPQWSFS